MSNLPVRTTSRGDAALISEFYIIIHSLASTINPNMPLHKELVRISDLASEILNKDSYSYKMYDYVKKKFESGIKWEHTRDSIYNRYQVKQMDGYDITSRELYCNGCFASGINFASSLVSYFYGKGDFKETIKIASLSGWDSDNPALRGEVYLDLYMEKLKLKISLINHFQISTTFTEHVKTLKIMV